jgi:nucleoside-diphosphate-sugar epimerase
MSNSKKILITGGTGFIGQHLIALWKKQHTLYVLSRKKNITIDGVDILNGDLSTIHHHKEILAEIDFVINIAGDKKNVALMQATNVEGLRHLLEAISEFPTKVLHVSSAGIYGIEQQEHDEITEETICLPNNTYEKSKFEAEIILKAWGDRHADRYIAIRPSNVFGPLDPSNKLLTLCKALQSGKFFFIDKGALVNYVSVTQVVHAIDQLIKTNRFENNFFNVNAPMTIAHFIELLRTHLGNTPEPKTIPAFLKPLVFIAAKFFDLMPKRLQFFNSGKYRELTSHKYYNVQKLERFISFEHTKDLETGIENHIENFKKQGLL